MRPGKRIGWCGAWVGVWYKRQEDSRGFGVLGSAGDESGARVTAQGWVLSLLLQAHGSWQSRPGSGSECVAGSENI